ncbi:MAG TPA: SCO family protein [Polyangia bacterium]
MTRGLSLARLALVLAGGVSAAVVVGPAGDAHAYMKMRGNLPNVGGGEGRFSDSDINIVENLGQRIPSGLVLQDGHGKPVAIDSQLKQGKPLLVTMGYFRCPLLCNLVHEGLAKGLKDAGLVAGKDFLGLAVSIDPNENPKSAATNQRRLLRALGEPPESTWPFLMPAPGAAGPEARLAEAVGFRYKFDDKSKQFAHAAVAFVLTPEGTISRYLYGVDFKPRDLRFALVEASGGRVGTTLDRILLTCFKYDPMTQSYSPFVFGFVRIGALLSFAALAALLAVLWRREVLMKRRRLA